jgi:pyruvate dehydrogenase E1 component alpha subunit
VSVSFGDGASNTGTFHEAMNLASLWSLPVIFVCQNNQLGADLPTEHTTKIERIADRAMAYGMSGLRIDGNDPEEVYRTVGAAADRGRTGGGPTLVECVTFRLEDHSWGDQQSASTRSGSNRQRPPTRFLVTGASCSTVGCSRRMSSR